MYRDLYMVSYKGIQWCTCMVYKRIHGPESAEPGETAGGAGFKEAHSGNHVSSSLPLTTLMTVYPTLPLGEVSR